MTASVLSPPTRLLMKRAFEVVAGITFLLVGAGIAVIVTLESITFDAERLPLYKFYLDIFVFIFGGFLAALLGVLIPRVLAEVRADVEASKVARLAYSEAKTGFDYLKVRLIAMTLSEATAHIQSVHAKKHYAELFPEFLPFLTRSEGVDVAKTWTRNFYNASVKVREQLQLHSSEWNELSPTQRLAILDATLANAQLIEESTP
jgi:hypothetical protein